MLAADPGATVTPHTCATEICPIHGTNHADVGGGVEVHHPDHPSHPWLFRGRRCVTKRELEADRAGVSVAELEARIRRDWRPGMNATAFLDSIRAGTAGPPPSALAVPQVSDDDVLGAAHRYIEAGWFVLPVRKMPGKGYRHAGSFLGKGWPRKTSNEPEIIELWFGGQYRGLGLALHVGRSGGIAFDVDHPEHVHPLLLQALKDTPPAFQSTSKVDPLRGHYVYRLPEGVVLGNSLGDLKTSPKWGEVRGTNGIIVADPTPRDEPSKQYRWVRAGELPELPKVLARALLRLDRPERKGKDKPKFQRNHITRPGPGRIRGLVNAVLSAEDGKQRELLFWAACRFGEMVSADVIDEQVARDLLIDTGLQLHNFDPAKPWTEESVDVQVKSGLQTGKWATS